MDGNNKDFLKLISQNNIFSDALKKVLNFLEKEGQTKEKTTGLAKKHKKIEKINR